MERTWIVTDSSSSFSSSDFTIAGEELGLGAEAFCAKRTLSGGRQSGVELIELSNGVVTLRICPTRGMGIIDGRFSGRHLGWRSPVREIVHPAYINLYDLGGRGAHYGFSEFLNRCGIEWSGAMGNDETVDNMGGRASVFLPLHGKVGWTPASRVEITSTGGQLVLRGDVPEQNVFGVNYLLKTRLTLTRGSSRIEIRDTLCNLGALPGEYEMLYHINFGPPFLEKHGSHFATYDRVIPRDGFADAGLADMASFPGPSAGFVEQVFLFRARADRSGRAHQLITNADRSLAARVAFVPDTLPYAILWKRCSAEKDGYVAGLNPCSDLPNSRRTERGGGRVGRIAPGEEVVFACSIELLDGTKPVAAAIGEIEAVNAAGPAPAAGDPGAFDWL